MIMADKSTEALGEILSQARLSIDEAVNRLRAGEAIGTLSASQLRRMQAQADNTSCTNTGCGGSRASVVDSVKAAG
jgi:hypothetical protein